MKFRRVQANKGMQPKRAKGQHWATKSSTNVLVKLLLMVGGFGGRSYDLRIVWYYPIYGKRWEEWNIWWVSCIDRMASQWPCNGLALASLMWPSEGTWLRNPLPRFNHDSQCLTTFRAWCLQFSGLVFMFFTCLFTVDLRMQKCKSCMA